MRIGMVSATYDPTVVNGAVHMVTLYKKHLEALGHEVTIFTLGEQTDTDRANRVTRSPGIRLGGYGYYLSNSYTREAQDAYALTSLARAREAQSTGAFAAEIAPVAVTSRWGATEVAEDERHDTEAGESGGHAADHGGFAQPRLAQNEEVFAAANHIQAVAALLIATGMEVAATLSAEIGLHLLNRIAPPGRRLIE